MQCPAPPPRTSFFPSSLRIKPKKLTHLLRSVSLDFGSGVAIKSLPSCPWISESGLPSSRISYSGIILQVLPRPGARQEVYFSNFWWYPFSTSSFHEWAPIRNFKDTCILLLPPARLKHERECSVILLLWEKDCFCLVTHFLWLPRTWQVEEFISKALLINYLLFYQVLLGVYCIPSIYKYVKGYAPNINK